MNKQNNIDDLFRQAREQQSQASFNETKDLFLKSLGSQKANLGDAKKGKVFTFKNSIIMSVLIGIIALSGTLFFLQYPSQEKIEQKTFQEKTEAEDISNQNANVNTKDSQETKTPIISQVKTEKTNELKLNKIHIASFIDEIKKEAGLDGYQDQIQDQESKIYNLGFVSKLDDTYVFPKLTEEEIEKTKKQKKKMLRALAKMDKDFYSYIPSGSFDYKGNVISVQAFYMQKTEVSNLEYRTYLFDLLIHDKKDEFLKAKPNQQAWKTALGDSAQFMIDTYFSFPGYDDYPVNNISREGAEMYCKWLTTELIKFVGDKNTGKYNDMRIPTREEWVKAASVEGKYPIYGFEDSTLYDKKYGAYKANFNLKDYHGPMLKRIKDSVHYFKYYPVVRSPFLTSPECLWVNHFYTNTYGLREISGNVAEMVYDWSGGFGNFQKKEAQVKSHGTAGGGWMNSAEEIKINAPDNHPNVVEAHPNIGFRIITTHSAGVNY